MYIRHDKPEWECPFLADPSDNTSSNRPQTCNFIKKQTQILRNFYKHPFYRSPLGDCLWTSVITSY